MSSVNPKDNAAKLRKRSENAGSPYTGPYGLSMGGSFFGKPVAGQSKNPRSLNNGLGAALGKENPGMSLNTPNKKRTLL